AKWKERDRVREPAAADVQTQWFAIRLVDEGQGDQRRPHTMLARIIQIDLGAHRWARRALVGAISKLERGRQIEKAVRLWRIAIMQTGLTLAARHLTPSTLAGARQIGKRLN